MTEKEPLTQRGYLTCLWSRLEREFEASSGAEQISRGQAWQRDLQVGEEEGRRHRSPYFKSPAKAAPWPLNSVLPGPLPCSRAPGLPRPGCLSYS